MTITCKQCGIDFERPPKRGRLPRYCSDECKRAADRAAAREKRAARRAAGLCLYSTGCPAPAAPGRGGLCASHADENAARMAATYAANPERGRERSRETARSIRARLAARSDDEIAADLARVLAKSPDGLLQCRAGHRAPAEDFSIARARRSGRDEYCRAHKAERDARRATEHRARLLARWEERDLYRCYITGVDFEDDGPHALHADHQWSLALGGPDVEENLFPATAAANLSKSKRPFHDVIEEHHPGVLAAVADWPRVVIDLDTGEVTGDEDAAEFVAPLLGEEADR